MVLVLALAAHSLTGEELLGRWGERHEGTAEPRGPGTTAEIFRFSGGKGADCREAIARDGAPIRFRHSTKVPADEAAFCVFDATTR